MRFQFAEARRILSTDRYLNKPALVWNARELMAMILSEGSRFIMPNSQRTVNQNKKVLHRY
jgi:hypothetical protein